MQTYCREIVLRADIGKVERAVLTYPIKQCILTNRAAGIRHGTKMSPQNRRVSLVEPQQHVVNPTNLCRALDDGIEHRLPVRGRAADDAEDLRCRRLMLQSFGELLAQLRICWPLRDC